MNGALSATALALAPGGPRSGPEGDRDGASPLDLRLVVLAGCGWAGALLGLLAPPAAVVALAGVTLVGAVVLLRHSRSLALTVGCGGLVAVAVAASAVVRVEANRSGVVGDAARHHVFVEVSGRVASDPVVREGRFAPYVVVRLDVTAVARPGAAAVQTSSPVLVLGSGRRDGGWHRVRLGDTVTLSGGLEPSEGPELAGVLQARTVPEVTTSAGMALDAAERVRTGIRDSVAGGSPAGRALVPALVVGDDQGMAPDLVADFRTTGLTHLAAVSGTNLTLVVGFVLVIARWAGARARTLTLVGLAGVVGFVVLARAEPSVVRAAAMGGVALLGMASDGRGRGVRALGAAVVGLLLVDPFWALSPGFALSVLATAGILFLAPALRDRGARWAPRWVAEAVAVPLAAQLACTPVVAALSHEVSLVAVVANLVVAPAVAPATVLGLLGGLLAVVAEPAGRPLGLLATLSADWIIGTAVRLADLPTASTTWPAGGVAVAWLTALTVTIGALAVWVAAHPAWCVVATVGMVALVLLPLPRPGWPPDGWALVACDVGQGDALAVRTGERAAIVIDAGPDPDSVDRCLDRLHVTHVPMLVLTHFHADHVAGLPGVLDDRRVDRVRVSPLAEPPGGAAAVRSLARTEGLATRVVTVGGAGRFGAVRWQVLGPTRAYSEGEESAANNSSVVLLLEVAGVRVLTTGDVEPSAQADLRRLLPGLEVEVLKVPHHGSSHQDPALLASLRPRVALISVGDDNDYGHPAPSLVAALERQGTLVRRTDVGGDLAVVADRGRLTVRSAR